MDDLPVSTAIRPRPVWARWQRRFEIAGKHDLPEPSEIEKHDAICVLREQFHWDLRSGPVTDVVLEAERIFIEASS